MTLQKKATIVASLTAILLTIIKLTIGIISGSIAVIASAIDSILDLVVSVFNYFAIHNSEKPADEKFNYGRGKIEALAGVIEGTVITISGLFIFYQSIINTIEEKVIKSIDISIIVMLISILITTILVIYLNYVAKKTNSLVIKSDALHYKTDIWSNIVILLSLILVYLTELNIIDSIIGCLIAIYIIYSAYAIIKEGVFILLDGALNDDDKINIIEIIECEKEVTSYHYLKTRESANTKFVDVHLVFTPDIILIEAHNISDNIEDKIREIDNKSKWIISIHLDPYDDSVIIN